MMIDLINKILNVLFFVSVLNTSRHLYYFIQSLVSSTEELPVKYRLTPKALTILGLSLAYILSACFIGIKI